MKPRKQVVLNLWVHLPGVNVYGDHVTIERGVPPQEVDHVRLSAKEWVYYDAT